MIKPQSAPSLVFCGLYRTSPSVAAKKIINSDSSVDHLVLSTYRVFSCVVGRWCLLWPVHSLGKTLLSFALCTPRPNLPVTPGISWFPTFAFQSSIIKGHFCVVLVLESLVGLHWTVQPQLLWHSWLWHRLGLLWYWIVCTGNEERSFYLFWDCTKVFHFELFVFKLWGLLHFF